MATKDKKGGTKAKPKSGIPPLSPASKTPKGTGSARSRTTIPAPVPIVESGAEKARKNRLKRAGVKIQKCPITGLPLDIGPRANEWLTPTELHGKVMSRLARAIFESGIPASDLKKVADFLSKMF